MLPNDPNFTLSQELLDSPQVQVLIELIRAQAETIQKQAEDIDAFKKDIQNLKDEIDRLRNTPKRPKFKPGGMEPRDRNGKPKNGSSSKKPGSNMGRSSTTRVTEEIRVAAESVPEGSRFKGYQNFSVEEVELVAKQIMYRLEVWQTQDGKVIRARVPKELKGKHFGTGLGTLVTNLYAHGVTQPALLDFLSGIGTRISSGQLSNLLLAEGEKMMTVSEAILSAGLREAPYIRTDDTGDKHRHKNSYCTHIGGEHFAYYKTTPTKSRANFLGLLLQGVQEQYFINDAMIWHLFQCGVADDVLNLFEEQKGKRYRSKGGLHRLLNDKGVEGKRLRSQCCEAAVVGFISETILRPGQVLLSDRAGQFSVFDHAACWVHMERPMRKISLTSTTVEEEWTRIRSAIWELYKTLKEAALTQTNQEEVHRLYDELLEKKTVSPAITAVLTTFRTYRDEMLKALDHPGLPLHNNDSERDIRGVAKRRNLSGSTKSDLGRKFRDGLTSLKQTCFRLELSFWDYLQGWFKGKPPDLADLVRQRYRAAAS